MTFEILQRKNTPQKNAWALTFARFWLLSLSATLLSAQITWLFNLPLRPASWFWLGIGIGLVIILKGCHLTFRERLIFLVIQGTAVGLSVWIMGRMHDISWDGQFYHQWAIYHMLRGLNFIWDLITHQWFWPQWYFPLPHYPKLGEITGAAFTAVLQNVEKGKSVYLLWSFAVFLRMYTTLRRFFNRKGALAASVVVLMGNPVWIYQIWTYYVDHLLYLCWLYLATSLVDIYFSDTKAFLGEIFLAGWLLMNTKATGILLWFLTLLTWLLYLGLTKQKPRYLRHLALGTLGLLLLSWHPYWQNFLLFGNPLYPLNQPQVYQANNEKQMPLVLQKMSPEARVYYAYFASFPTNRHQFQPHPSLRAYGSFLAHPLRYSSQMKGYLGPDPVFGGWGPYYGPLLGLVLLYLMVRWPSLTKRQRLFLGALLPGVLFTLFSPIAWWPRYIPYLWGLTLSPWLFPPSRSTRLLWGAVLLLALANAFVVGWVNWPHEYKTSRERERVLRQIQAIRPYVVYFGENPGNINLFMMHWQKPLLLFQTCHYPQEIDPHTPSIALPGSTTVLWDATHYFQRYPWCLPKSAYEFLEGVPFTDVRQLYWARVFIERLYIAGIVEGYSDGTFRPEASLTLEEGATWLGKLLYFREHQLTLSQPLNIRPPQNPAAKIQSHQPSPWIDLLEQRGILTKAQYEAHFAEPLTRAQMAVHLLKIEHGGSYRPPQALRSRFPDVPEDYWAKDWIEALVAEGIAAGYQDGTFRPERPLSRAEAAVWLARLLQKP